MCDPETYQGHTSQEVIPYAETIVRLAHIKQTMTRVIGAHTDQSVTGAQQVTFGSHFWPNYD